MDQIQVGVIGAGFMGGLHARAVAESGFGTPVAMAAEHGCAILVEKPIAASLEDADAMIAACDAAGVPLMVGYILRFEPAYARIHQAVEAGNVGTFFTGYGRPQAPIRGGGRAGGGANGHNQ